MAKDEWEHSSLGDMLYAGTGRTVLVEALVAAVSLGGLISLSALTGGLWKHGFSEPRWEWAFGMAVVDRLGASVLADIWSILGVFATVLVAVALAGRGTFTMKDARETAEKTESGLLRGPFDRRLSLLVACRIALFCGTFLAISALLVLFHVAHGFAGSFESGIEGPDLAAGIEGSGQSAGAAAIAIPVMIGGILLSAHIGAFVTDPNTRLRELKNLEVELRRRCDRIRRRISPRSRASGVSSIVLVFWRTVTLVLLPGVALAGGFRGASPRVLEFDGIFLGLTSGVAAVTVLTPWMTDVLNGWSEKVFVVWWWLVVALVHAMWVLAVVFMVAVSGIPASIPLVIAAMFYLFPVAIFWFHYRRVSRFRSSSEVGFGWLSPFLAVDRVVLWDRCRQLGRVESQILELERRSGISRGASVGGMSIAEGNA